MFRFIRTSDVIIYNCEVHLHGINRATVLFLDIFRLWRKWKLLLPVMYSHMEWFSGSCWLTKPFVGFEHFQVTMKIVKGEVSLAWQVQVHNSIHYVWCSVQYFISPYAEAYRLPSILVALFPGLRHFQLHKESDKKMYRVWEQGCYSSLGLTFPFNNNPSPSKLTTWPHS